MLWHASLNVFLDETHFGLPYLLIAPCAIFYRCYTANIINEALQVLQLLLKFQSLWLWGLPYPSFRASLCHLLLNTLLHCSLEPPCISLQFQSLLRLRLTFQIGFSCAGHRVELSILQRTQNLFSRRCWSLRMLHGYVSDLQPLTSFVPRSGCYSGMLGLPPGTIALDMGPCTRLRWSEVTNQNKTWSRNRENWIMKVSIVTYPIRSCHILSHCLKQIVSPKDVPWFWQQCSLVGHQVNPHLDELLLEPKGTIRNPGLHNS